MNLPMATWRAQAASRRKQQSDLLCTVSQRPSAEHKYLFYSRWLSLPGQQHLPMGAEKALYLQRHHRCQRRDTEAHQAHPVPPPLVPRTQTCAEQAASPSHLPRSSLVRVVHVCVPLSRTSGSRAQESRTAQALCSRVGNDIQEGHGLTSRRQNTASIWKHWPTGGH